MLLAERCHALLDSRVELRQMCGLVVTISRPFQLRSVVSIMHSFLGHESANVEVGERELMHEEWPKTLVSPSRGHVEGQGAQEMLWTLEERS